MRGLRYADVVRRLLREAHREPPPGVPSDRGRLVSTVEQALRARARRRVAARRAIAGAGVTVAAAAAFVLVVGRPWHRASEAVATPAHASRALTVLAGAEAPGAVVAGANPPVALKSGTPIAAGLTLRAPAAGEVHIGTIDGTSLALEDGGELAVTETGATQRFALRAGAVRAHVSRQFAGERFIVDTPDAEVEVHGTSFRVAVVPSVASCGDGTTTRVSVLEGVVRVRAAGREASVFPGGVWPDGCEALSASAARTDDRARGHVARARAAAAHEAEPPAERTGPEPAVALPAVPTPASSAPTVPASSLGAENDLFAAAVHAKKQGRAAEAAQLFGDLVTSHPASPLVESAMAQRMKALAAVNPAAGAAAAAAYLERFPGGFAAPEARELSDRQAP